MAAVDNSVMTSLSSLNALAGKISPQTPNGNDSNGGSSPRSNRSRQDSQLMIYDADNADEMRVLNSVHREPDPDAIKMFVGQIPRSMDENDLRKMFEDYGEVSQINVLRDKSTGQSKSCCFVTFYTRKAALAAQNELHNIKTLPGMHHPIQMKPADTENKNERKLFIGMLNKRYTEQDVRHMFSNHGTIEECTVLRDSNSQSKGCAFVTFSARHSAINAIKKMHHSQTMEGCSAPLVVKFADTQKEKDAKRFNQVPSFWNMTSSNNGINSFAPHYLAMLQQQLANSANTGTPLNTLNNQLSGSLPQLTNINVPQLLASQSNLQTQQMFESPGKLPSVSSLNSLSLPTSNNGSLEQPSLQGLLATMSTQNSGFSSMGAPSIGGSAPAASGSNSSTKQLEGPEGANLFIYHLPQEFGDSDLAQTFWPFGRVISARVFIDKQTNLSKCFGFVSYDSPLDAQRAISIMNGHPIGNKRLKVQLKRSKSDSKPY